MRLGKLSTTHEVESLMISVSIKGNFDRTEKFLESSTKFDDSRRILHLLKKYGDQGIEALEKSTPKDTGRTANSWGYTITKSRNGYTIYWTNSNIQDGFSIAVILDTGHATRQGGYVKGVNYIRPTIRPVFDQIANAAWKEVAKNAK